MNKRVRVASTSLLAISATAVILSQTGAAAQASTIKKQTDTLYVNGHVYTHASDIVLGRTIEMPIQTVQQLLTKLGITNKWTGSTLRLNVPSYVPVDLTNLRSSKGNTSITLNGKTIVRFNRTVYSPAPHKPNTYIPVQYLTQIVNRIGINSAWSGHAWKLSNPPAITATVASTAQYPTLHLRNNGYPVVLLQQKLNAAGYNVGAIDGEFGPKTRTEVMAFQRANGLTADGIVGQQTWQAMNQRLSTIFTQPAPATPLPAPSNPAPSSGPSIKIVQAWAFNGNSMMDAENEAVINRINNDSFTISSTGSINNASSAATNSGLLTFASSANATTFGTVTDVDPSTGAFSGTYAASVLGSQTARTALEQNLVNVAVANNYTGIDLDFENIPDTSAGRAMYSQFVTELSKKLHAANKQLSVTVPAETGADSEPWDNGYDYASIGQAADWVPIMAYDFSWSGSAPGPVAPYYWDESVIKYAASAIPANKIILGLPTYGYDWDTTAGSPAKALSLTAVDALIQKNNITPLWDSTDAVPYFTYTDANGDAHTVYYENEASITQKLGLVNTYQLAGIAFWRSGLEDQSFWDAVTPWMSK